MTVTSTLTAETTAEITPETTLQVTPETTSAFTPLVSPGLPESYAPQANISYDAPDLTTLITLLATINNSNTACTGSDTYTITLSPGGDYRLTQPIQTSRGPSGLVLSRAGNCTIIINGNGATLYRDPNAQPFRILYIVGGGLRVEINNVVIRNGLINSQSNVDGAHITHSGAGIYVEPQIFSFILTSSIVTGNQITGIQQFSSGAGIFIYGTGSTLIDNSIFVENSISSPRGKGAGIGYTSEYLQNTGVGDKGFAVSNTDVFANDTTEIGGGIFLRIQHRGINGSRLVTTFFNISVFNNTAVNAAGGMALEDGVGSSNTLVNSCIYGNVSTNGGISDITSVPALNAQSNWWGSAQAPGSARVNSGVTTSNFLTVLPADLCQKAGQARILFATDEGATWQNEQANVLTGVERTGRALYALLLSQNRSPASWENAFNRVMVEAEPGYILFVRANSSTSTMGGASPDVMIPHPTIANTEIPYADIDSGVCKAFPGDPSTSIPQSVICNGNVNVTEYTTVHELGHLFDYRSGSVANPGLSISLGRNGLVNIRGCPVQGFNNGKTIIGELLAEFPPEWVRGNSGWGSGPAFSDFQQNVTNDTGKSVEEIFEAAADMFLNWVYRYSSTGNSQSSVGISQSQQGVTQPTSGCVPVAQQIPANATPVPQNWEGFQNIDWSIATTFDWSYPGDVRFAFMSQTIIALANSKGW